MTVALTLAAATSLAAAKVCFCSPHSNSQTPRRRLVNNLEVLTLLGVATSHGQQIARGTQYQFTCTEPLLRHPERSEGPASAVDVPVGIASSEAQNEIVKRIDDSLRRAGLYLAKTQSKDGAWRSNVYGALKEGFSLTPLAANALFFMPQGGKEVKVAFNKSVQFLIRPVNKKGFIDPPDTGFTYPTMSAAIICRVLGLRDKTPEIQRAHDAWLAYLMNRRLGPQLGWKPEDLEFGAWGFCPVVPRKPGPGDLKPIFDESNIVATIFGVAAMRGAQPPIRRQVYDEVLLFIKRCQNFSDDPAQHEASFDDGGFFFIPTDEVQNRAGTAGKDKLGRLRYKSYGSVTADGLRALIRLGEKPDSPRVVAARKWLEWNFSSTTNPGDFKGDRAIIQDAAYYYYVWAVTHAFLALNLTEIETREGKINWIPVLCEELLKRQKPDGSWKSGQGDAKEDDPVIATSFATSTLAVARQMLTGEAKQLR
jgi:hypothetical protein